MEDGFETPASLRPDLSADKPCSPGLAAIEIGPLSTFEDFRIKTQQVRRLVGVGDEQMSAIRSEDGVVHAAGDARAPDELPAFDVADFELAAITLSKDRQSLSVQREAADYAFRTATQFLLGSAQSPNAEPAAVTVRGKPSAVAR